MNEYGNFPTTRLRRLRLKSFSRRLRRENSLSTSDLIWPLFIHPDQNAREPVPSLPGVERLGEKELRDAADQALHLGIPMITLFPVIPQSQKSIDAAEAYNPEGLVPERIKFLKKEFPELGIMTDVALDPYTTHGLDGLINDHGQILNDETVTVLKRQALCHAQAGADMVGPSDMMDGRIGAIRRILDDHDLPNVGIISYAAKFASNFYGPFRDAVGSSANLGSSSKETFQLDPANSEEAMREIAFDIQEGADMVMVKPGGPYLDIVQRAHDNFPVPILAYQVSGEYAMVKAAAKAGWLNEEACMMESMMAFKRAGCSGVLTYFAPQIAKLLKTPSRSS